MNEFSMQINFNCYEKQNINSPTGENCHKYCLYGAYKFKRNYEFARK